MEISREIDGAAGLLAERFALCQTLPLARFEAVAAALGQSGYRPVRLRPYRADGKALVAAVWTRDGRPWRATLTENAAAVTKSDAAHRKDGYRAQDVAGYLADDGTPRFAALWLHGTTAEETRLYVGVLGGRHDAKLWGLWQKDGFGPLTCQAVVDGAGVRLFSGVWRKPAAGKADAEPFVDLEGPYEAQVAGAGLQADTCVYRVPLTRHLVARAPAGAIAAAQAAVRAKPDDGDARWSRAQAYLAARRWADALADLDFVVGQASQFAPARQQRALARAHTGDATGARADVAAFAKLDPQGSTAAYLDAHVAALLGDDMAGMKRLEAAVAAHAADAGFLYEAARAAALSAAATAERAAARIAAAVGMAGGAGAAAALVGVGTDAHPATFHAKTSGDAAAALVRVGTDGPAADYADRAVALLRQAVAAGYREFAQLNADDDFDFVRKHADFRAVLAAGHLDRRYAAVWHDGTHVESAETHGLDPAAHRVKCQELAAAGYRPAALSVAEIAAGKPAVTASVWHRPLVAEAARVAQARRKASAAAALLRLSQGAQAWPVLRHTPTPDARSYLVLDLAPRGVEATLLIKRLDEEKDVSARRALILALGEYTEEQLPAAARKPLVQKLLGWYRNDPDAGIHGAIDWLLRHGKEGPVPRKLDWGQAAALAAIEDELKGKPPPARQGWYVAKTGGTMTVVRGPVEFMMGSLAGEAERSPDETPHHRRIGRSFAVAAKAVTVGQWKEFLGASPPGVPTNWVTQYAPEDACPINGVDWYTAAKYCRWLSEQEGLEEKEMCYPKMADIKEGMKPYPDYLSRTGYRLPTEAEWEYACRAGAPTVRYYGSDAALLPRYGWFLMNNEDRTWPVGQKRPNDFGLFDQHGNVWTWVQDGYADYVLGPDRKTSEDKEDIRDVQDTLIRVLRGGAFDDRPSNLRSSFRNRDRPSNRNIAFGLRVARTYR